LVTGEACVDTELRCRRHDVNTLIAQDCIDEGSVPASIERDVDFMGYRRENGHDQREWIGLPPSACLPPGHAHRVEVVRQFKKMLGSGDIEERGGSKGLTAWTTAGRPLSEAPTDELNRDSIQ
jgi:hypothetical protein